MAIEVKKVFLPAQEWAAFSKAYSADLLMEADVDVASGVRVHEYEGFLYTVMSISYLGSQGFNLLEAWQLVPEAMYRGEIFENRNWDALKAMGRERGDFTGYKVKVRGKVMICAKEVSFVESAPTVRAITLDEAQRIDANRRQQGWRAHMFSGASPKWKYHQGHAVAVYESGRGSRHVLLWRNGRSIEEFSLSKELVLDEVINTRIAMHAAAESMKQPVQAALF